MPRFKPGDRVQRIGESLAPGYMKEGVVLRVMRIPLVLGEIFTEYEVDFKFVRAAFFEGQLAPADDHRNHKKAN